MLAFSENSVSENIIKLFFEYIMFSNTISKSGMKAFFPFGRFLFMPIDKTTVFFHWCHFLFFYDSFLSLVFLWICLFISIYALISFYITIFISGKTIELPLCYSLLNKIFCFMFLSFKLYPVSVMITANTHWVVIVYQVLGQILFMLIHLILKKVLCNKCYYCPHFTNEKMKNRSTCPRPYS